MLAGYARVSKSEQAENSDALLQQQHRLKKAGATEIYTDIQSGRRDDRPSLAALLDKVRLGLIKTLVITRYDRIARSARFNAEIMLLLEESGVLLKVLDEGDVDFSTPHGWKRTQQAGIDAEFESRMLSKRVRDGYVFLREEKKASPKVPYGYKREFERYELDMSVYEIARSAIALYIEVKNLTDVTRLIYEKYGKSWSVAGLRNWLLNPVLVGHTPYGSKAPRKVGVGEREIIYLTHSDRALMSEAEQQQISEILTNNVRFWGANTKPNTWCNPLSGLIYCGTCGHTMDILSKPSGGKRSPKRIIRYAYCRVRGKKIVGLSCDEKSTVKFDVIMSHAIAALTNAAQSITRIGLTPKRIYEPPQLKELRASLAALQGLGNNSAILEARLKIEAQITNFGTQSDVMTAVKCENQKVLVDTFSDPGFWEHLTDKEKQIVFRRLVERVVVKGGEIIFVILKV
ncbi:MAG: fdxN element excision recombinase XisF [Chroococcidiopsis sp.]